MSAMATVEYGTLLQRTQPRIIRTEEQNEIYIKQLEELSSRDDLTADERELAELLTVLIEDFEEKHYALSRISGAE